eukprot:604082-Hanusia_phi.AAC.3
MAVASESHKKVVHIWDAELGAFRQVLSGHSEQVRSVSIGGDGETVASGSDDGTVRVWDVETGKCLQVLEGHEGGVGSVNMRADGRSIVTVSDDRSCKVLSLSGDDLNSFERSLQCFGAHIQQAGLSEDARQQLEMRGALVTHQYQDRSKSEGSSHYSLQ